MTYPKFSVEKSKNNQFYFNLHAVNAKIILTATEMYTSKKKCLNDINSVKINSLDDSNYIKKISIGKDPYFILEGLNNDVIGKSEMYSSNEARDNGINAVKRDAHIAEIEENLN